MPQKLSIPNLSLQDRLAARKPQSALARALALEAEGKPERAFKLFVIAAEAGMTEAERELGEHYLSGRGVLRNRVEAARWFARAADKGDLTACRHLAGLYMTGVQESEIADASTALFNAPPKPGSDCDAALRYAMQAAEAGDVRAQEMAAAIHLLGPAHLRDEDKAKSWFGKAADSGSAHGHLGYGIITLIRSNDDDSTFAGIAHIRKAAQADLGWAHYYLALIHELAIGVRTDVAAAATHYGLAAKAGLRNAQAKYGSMLLHGVGLKANTVEGETWLRRAGLAGDAQAAARVASIYTRQGGTLPPNFAEAAIWFRLAAEAGHRPSAHALGILYLTGAGVPRDADESAIWLRRAAEAGDPDAQSNLASLLLNRRTNPNITEPAPVHEWFEQAAEAGDLVGAFNYAVCLAQGVGVKRDDARAAHWFRIAAEGVLNAKLWYARILAEGRGVEANPAEARAWYRKCCDLELPEALIELADMHIKGQGGPPDHEAARTLYERAAIRGHASAMFALGAMYGGGHDIPTDRAAALAWYRQAAEKNHPKAALMLGKYLAMGIATPPNPTAARHWLTQARNAGIPEAETALAQLPPEPVADTEAAE